MHRLVLWLQAVLIPVLGPGGLFAVAFFDSSFLSIPEVNDILVVTEAGVRPGTVWVYVVMVTLGSVAGCSALWLIGKRGGEPMLVRRFGTERMERTRLAFRRWDVLALAVPALLPPPMPFKVFVFSAGVFGVRFPRFLLAIALARGLRYTVWAVMGTVFGARALALLKSFDVWFAGRGVLAVALLALTVAVTAVVASRRRRAPA